MATSTSAATTRPGVAALFRAGGVAALVAAVLNTVIFYAGTMDPSVLNPAGQPISLGAVLAFSVIPPLAAAALLYALLRWTPGRALPIFWGIAAVVFVAFIFGPFSLGAPAGMVWTLQIMHVAVAVPTVWFLTRAARA